MGVTDGEPTPHIGDANPTPWARMGAAQSPFTLQNFGNLRLYSCGPTSPQDFNDNHDM